MKTNFSIKLSNVRFNVKDASQMAESFSVCKDENDLDNSKFDRNAEFAVENLEFAGEVEYTPAELIEIMKQGGDMVHHVLDLVKNKQDQKNKKEEEKDRTSK